MSAFTDTELRYLRAERRLARLAIRRIGADRMVLLGHSWGAQVAAGYLAAHPTHVARVMFSSPLQVNPQAAHAFVGDAEMDARNDRVYNAGRAGTHCRGAGPGPALHGLGFYTFQFPQSAAARPWADPRPALAQLAVPALVVKGSCDYLSWSSGLAYRQAVPGARLVYLRQAGHNAYQDQPAAFLAVVRAFLAGRPSPVPDWNGSGVPPDYEGPP